MTEEEWICCQNPCLMLDQPPGHYSERKLLLFACGCCRMIWTLLKDDSCFKIAVEVAEQFADGQCDRRRVNAVHRQARAAISAADKAAAMTCEPNFRVQLAEDVAVCAADAFAEWGAERESRYQAAMESQANLWRDLVGNPFRPAAFDPRWRTETVVSLASAIYAERAFDRMPVLADALEEAGCDHPDILGHCHGPGPHACGCWVVDGVLGKE